MRISPSPRRSTLLLGLLAGITAASTAAIFIRFAQHEGVPSIVISAARLTIASLILAPYAISHYRHEFLHLTRKDWFFALLSGFFLALHFATWITSLEYTSVASSAVLVSTAPLWVAMLAPLFLRERVELAAMAGLILALTGGIIVGASDACSWQAGALNCSSLVNAFSRTAFLGDSLALVGAWMAAGYMLVGRKLRSRMELIPYIFIVYGMAAVVLIAIMLGMKESPFGLPPFAYLWFLLLAVVPQLFGHSTFNWALKYLPASFVSITLLGEPIGSTILAYFIFQETPGWVKIGGAALILVGIWLAARTQKTS
jgi:drug/metabolite transporter (DMT)-like permease